MARFCQMVFQDPFSSLNPRMSVGRIVAEPLVIHGIKTARKRRVEVSRLLERVGLPEDSAGRYPHAFSGGQRQRIGIARALALRPKVLVADEPVSALDVSVQAQILNLLADLRDELGLTLILISHDLGVVQWIADRVLVLYLGRMAEHGPVDSVMTAPLHPYTQALIASAPRIEQREEGPPVPLQGEVPSALRPPSGCAFHPRCALRQPACSENSPEARSLASRHMVACHEA